MLSSTMAQRYHCTWSASRQIGLSLTAGCPSGNRARVCRSGAPLWRTLIGAVGRTQSRSIHKRFAHESIARVAAEVDDVVTYTEHLEPAKNSLAEIEDPKERDALAADIAQMSEV